jgi:selenide, water dikinase
LRVPNDPRVLIDYRTSDDAGVYTLDDGRALVQTVDFFTPIVDDPAVYGRIAAANALSDVYAMGGRPITALAIAAFPKDVGRDVLGAIFQGGLATLGEAGVALLGGHTVQGAEVKFGYAVTGEVHPSRVWSNAGARPGDAVLITKPIGTGIIATAGKFDRAPAAAMDAAVRSMIALNRTAQEIVMAAAGDAVHACTDVTGFSLLGHACEVAAASGCTIELTAAAVPCLPGALELVPGNVPGGGRANAEHFGPSVEMSDAIPADMVSLLYDPQTSGGLLFSLAADRAPATVSALLGAGVSAAMIGRVTERSGHLVVVR